MTEIEQVEHCKTIWKRSSGEIITYSEGSLMDIIQLARNDMNFLITTIESLQSKNGQYETTVTCQQEAFKDQGKEILRYRRELESQKEEITQLREELNTVRPLVDLELHDKKDLIESLQKDIERYKQALKPSVVYSAIRHYYKQGLFESDEYGDIENVMDLISRVQEGEKP